MYAVQNHHTTGNQLHKNSTLSTDTRNNYVIRGGSAGRERLRILGRVMRPGTEELFDRIGVLPGWSCLDMGCGGGDVTLALAERVGSTGAVVGVDRDMEVVSIARREAAETGRHGVTFRCGTVESFETTQRFDLVYCRFLLTHLADPPQALARMMELLKPGGVLVVEDIDFTGHFCYPESAAFQRYIDLYSQVVALHGGDPNIGPRLPSLLTQNGCGGVQVHVEQPVAMDGETKLLAPITWESIAHMLLAAELTTPGELAAVGEALFDFALDPETLMSLPRVIQTWGYRDG